MDVAHALGAAGSADGTVVLADAQTGGRGRAGRSWASGPGTGVWCTVVIRPGDPGALEVLSLRVGLTLAEELQPLSDVLVAVKWPNDLLVGGRKLAGVLVEARWRDARPEWVAVGVGVNVRPPAGFDDAAALRPGTARLDALAAVVRAVQRASVLRGLLTRTELARLAARDAVRGRRVVAPVAGTAAGLTAAGALRVEGPDGVHELRQATVVYDGGEAAVLPE
jgi:BirA family biotin operon repressor/biotin-[acetyl-CoA-carboxylase] ligase